MSKVWFSLFFALLFTLFAPSLQAQNGDGIIGQKVTVPAFRHPNPGEGNNLIRVMDAHGNPAVINYTITKQTGKASLHNDVSNDDLGLGELQESKGMLPAMFFSGSITATSDGTCPWDKTGSAAFPGDATGPYSSNIGTIISYSYIPMDGGNPLLMLVLRVELVNGRFMLVEKWRAHGVLAGFSPAERLSPNNPIPIDRPGGLLGTDLAWKSQIIWVKVPMMTNGANPRFNEKGSLEVSISRPSNAQSVAAYLFGYVVVMMEGCGTTPPEVETPAKLCPLPASFFELYAEERYLPRGIIWIPGVNFGNGVFAPAFATAIKRALESDDVFVREFVAWQLNFLWSSPASIQSLLNAKLRDYGIDFIPIQLDNGALLTADSTLRDLAVQASLARFASRGSDQQKIGPILELFNNSQPGGCADLCPLPCSGCRRN